MSMLSRWESRFARFAIPNLMTIVIMGQALVYVFHLSQRPNANAGLSVLERVKLDSSEVFAGEWWRVVTFLFDPGSANPLFLLISWWLLYMFGSVLERVWGVARFNLYVLIGYAASIAAALLPPLLGGGHMSVNNFFLYSSLFLAFARLFPDYEFLVFFVLPIKVKWLALIQWVVYGLYLFEGPWSRRWMILAAVSNYLLFFARSYWRDAKQVRRRRDFQQRTTKAVSRLSHVCRVCGINSDDHPRMAFRYCSKCAGQACYCPDHLREHEHVVEGRPT